MMKLLLFTMLGCAHGLRLKTEAASLPLAKTGIHFRQSMDMSQQLTLLKMEKHRLDASIAEMGQKCAEYNKECREDRHIASREESREFFDEPDSLWFKRRERQINAMAIQKAEMAVNGCEDCDAEKFWSSQYDASFGCSFERRVGFEGDGPTWICDTYKLRDADKCLMYNIGSDGQYSWEQSVHEQISKKCEIHTIDMKQWADVTPPAKGMKSVAPPEFVKYHVAKLGDVPLSGLVKEFGHAGREIDVLRIDCDGCEWSTFKSWFSDESLNIRQVLVELHGKGEGKAAHELFDMMFKKGYVVFHKELNKDGCQGGCVDYSFVKVAPSFVYSTQATLLNGMPGFKPPKHNHAQQKEKEQAEKETNSATIE